MSRFRLAVLIVIGLALSAVAQSGSWQIDPNHSTAQFAVKHLGISTVRGAFTKVSGSATYDPSEASKCSLNVSIDASSVDTRVEMRDKDLRSPNFLDVQKYPTITFQSKQVKSAGAGKLLITGDLTIHGTTKEVTLNVDGPSAPIKDPWGNQRIGASATTTINRMDYGVKADPGMVGDDIAITVDVELIQKPK